MTDTQQRAGLQEVLDTKGAMREVGDPEKALAPKSQASKALAVAIMWEVTQRMKDLSVFPSNSDFEVMQINLFFFKGRL